MLVVAIKTGSKTRAYATRCNVLEALNDIRKAAEKNERLLFTRRILAGFHADERHKDADVVVKTQENDCFSLEDEVEVRYASGPEYYRMRELVRIFSDLT